MARAKEKRQPTPVTYAKGLGPQQSYPEKVIWPGHDTQWLGHTKDGHFLVEDIVMRGVSERTITGGYSPSLKPIPLGEIEAKGGQVVVSARQDEELPSSEL